MWHPCFSVDLHQSPDEDHVTKRLEKQKTNLKKCQQILNVQLYQRYHSNPGFAMIAWLAEVGSQSLYSLCMFYVISGCSSLCFVLINVFSSYEVPVTTMQRLLFRFTFSSSWLLPLFLYVSVALADCPSSLLLASPIMVVGVPFWLLIFSSTCLVSPLLLLLLPTFGIVSVTFAVILNFPLEWCPSCLLVVSPLYFAVAWSWLLILSRSGRCFKLYESCTNARVYPRCVLWYWCFTK